VQGVEVDSTAEGGPQTTGKRHWWRIVIMSLREATTDQVALAAAGCGFYATMALFPAISAGITFHTAVWSGKL